MKRTRSWESYRIIYKHRVFFLLSLHLTSIERLINRIYYITQTLKPNKNT